jgi:hypothetical protein
MRMINLPEWNALPESIRAGLVEEGNYWDAFIGKDIAHGVYVRLRELLAGTNIDEPDPDAPELDLPDPWIKWPVATLGPPVSPDTLINVRFASGKFGHGRAGSFDWSRADELRITYYELTGR